MNTTTPPRNPYLIPLVIVTALFFMWGALTALNDVLIPHLKSVFELNYTQAMLVQFCFFSAYFVVSIPAGQLISHIGYQRGIVCGLTVAALGCLLFSPAASSEIYWVFLLALFVLASGITVLQVSANPYVTTLGAPETSASRLVLTQSFNSLGTTIAPALGSFLILANGNKSPEEIAQLGNTALEAYKASEAQAVQGPYLMLAATLFVMAVIFAVIKLPAITHALQKTRTSVLQNFTETLGKFPNLRLGAIGIFVYVGAEVSIGSILVNYFSQENIAGMTEESAGYYVSLYWMFAMIGRFVGAAVMLRIKPSFALTFNSVTAIALLLMTMTSSGSFAMWTILLVGLCNSIMFPTIFSIAVSGLGEHTSHGSGILCMAIVGGAVIPVIFGVLADSIGVQMAFLLPALCYTYIAYYGLRSVKSA